jgi:hypothetical protein
VASAKQRRKRRQARRRPPGDGPQAAAPGEQAATAPAPRPAKRRAQPADERPPAPWGKFPLVELTVLVALVMLGIGFFGGNPVALGVGLVLGSAAGLELSVREHFAGFRSHTLLLAATAFVAVVAALLYLAEAPVPVALGVGAVVFAGLFWALRAAFRRASGGLSFKAGLRF